MVSGSHGGCRGILAAPVPSGREGNRKMHPRGLEPPARRRAFPEGCKRAPTALRRSFTRSCCPWRLLSVTTFRADVAPPHVGSPSVCTRVAGAAKTGGSLPAVALSSREARADRLCNASRSVRPVFLGAALVGWCQTMNMKCVLARLSRAASGRHARRSPLICCARRIPARRVSPLFVNGLMKPRTNVEPKWWRQRGSNPQSCLPPCAPSGRVYSESHGAERYISATYLARPNPLCRRGKLRSSCLPLPPYPTRPTRCAGRALAFVAHVSHDGTSDDPWGKSPGCLPFSIMPPKVITERNGFR